MSYLANDIETTEKLQFKIEFQFWIRIGIIYSLSWILIYHDAPVGFRVGLLVLMFFFQLTSYYNATAIFLMALFVPFLDNMLGDLIRGLDIQRILFFPFLIYSFCQKKIRYLPGNRYMYWLIITALVLLQCSSAFQVMYRGMPLSPGSEEPSSWIDVLALVFDNFTIICFLYFTFTRLGPNELEQLLRLFLVFILLQSLSLLHMSIDHKHLLLNPHSQSKLWRNPFFGHKNEWSIIFVFVLVIAILRNFNAKSYRILYQSFLVIVISAIAVSLSRQAYIWTVLAFLLIALYKRNTKVILYMGAVFIALMIFRPAFLVQRMDEMVSAQSQEEFQELNSKVGDEAVNQAKDNFKIIPQMFVKKWEYNHSEGFWNGFLHQQGILGLVFLLYVYFFLYQRFRFFYTQKDELLQSYGIFGMVSIILMVLGNINRRHTSFMHYKGGIGEIGFFILFMILLSELTYYRLKNQHRNRIYPSKAPILKEKKTARTPTVST